MEDQQAYDNTLESEISHIDHMIKVNADLANYDFNRNKRQEVSLPDHDPSQGMGDQSNTKINGNQATVKIRANHQSSLTRQTSKPTCPKLREFDEIMASYLDMKKSEQV